jgi:glycosyltransferase involved in cell wall biosynthesis
MAAAEFEPPRILYFSWTLPTQGSGANLAMRRHFIENRDFEIAVVSNQAFDEPGIPFFRLPDSRLLNRLGSTRMSRVVQQVKMLYWTRRLPAELISFVKEFNPEAVFTIPDHNISWAAWRLARKTGLPLVTNFQDWWPRGQFYFDLERPYPPVRAVLENRMRRMYQDSKLVFCTSEGFMDYLGPHPNAHVLYPISAKEICDETPPLSQQQKVNEPFRILYTGTPFGSYGRLLLKFIRAVESIPEVEVIVYGAEPDWDDSTKSELREKGVYRGFLPYDQLRNELRSADAFLAIMSFDKELEVMMKTSFTTKVLDYCRRGRPVIVWGPDYCQPVKIIQEHEAGIVYTRPDTEGLVAMVQELKSSVTSQRSQSAQAFKLSQTLFKHEEIHEIFRSNLLKLVRDRS